MLDKLQALEDKYLDLEAKSATRTLLPTKPSGRSTRVPMPS